MDACANKYESGYGRLVGGEVGVRYKRPANSPKKLKIEKPKSNLKNEKLKKSGTGETKCN